MNRAVGLLAASICGLALLLVSSDAGAARVDATRVPTYGTVRAWHGTEIVSLDPVPAWLQGGHRRRARLVRARTTAAAAPRPDQVLSNEVTFTSWAYVYQPGPIYRDASAASATIGRLHWYTEDGFPEVYLLLSAHWDSSGQEWIHLRIPARPNGMTGWVPRVALGALHLTHDLLVVNRGQEQIYFYRNGQVIWSAPVAVGRPGTPTPPGHFWIRERFKITDPQSGYWPYAFGTSDYSTLTDWPGGGIVGIHGPYFAPQLIPGRISHGCIRLEVADDEWLAAHLGVGTPLEVV